MFSRLLVFGLMICSVGVSTSAEIEQQLVKMTFEKNANGWQTGQHTRAYLSGGNLCVEADGNEPSISRIVDEIGGKIHSIFRIRTKTESNAILYWTTKGSPRRSGDKMASLNLIADGNWHDYEFHLPVQDTLTGVTLRFSSAEGRWEIQSVAAFRRRMHPLTLERVEPYRFTDENGNAREMYRYTIKNNAPVPLAIHIDKLYKKTLASTEEETKEIEYWYGIITRSDSQENLEEDPHQPFRASNHTRSFEPVNKTVLPGNRTMDLIVPIVHNGNLSSSRLLLKVEGFPDIGFPVFRYYYEGKTDWISCPFNQMPTPFVLEIAPDARMARIMRNEEILGIIAPIVHRNGVLPDFKLLPQTDSQRQIFQFDSTDANLEIRAENNSIRFLIEDKSDLNPTPTDSNSSAVNVFDPVLVKRLEGPVVRIRGALQSGLLPGVEFLGPNDASSSEIDLIPPYNLRSFPTPQWLTMPLAVLGTTRSSIMLQWNDMSLQPTFSTPNRFDFSDDHRISLIGQKIDATLKLLDCPPMLAAVHGIEHFLSERGLPESPPAPRTSEEQRRLTLLALTGSLQAENETAWGYAAEQVWPRRPYADFLSTLARLTGRSANPQEIVSGGADIANDSIYFLTGQVEQWKKSREEAIRSFLPFQNPDGSFLHRTRFPEVETAITSFGYTAIRALEIMEYVRLTGDVNRYEHVQKSLNYLKKCTVPRGASYRDAPMHTPDLQTATSLLWLAVWAYEFDGNKEYLELARRAALMGMPFVYQWSNRDTMLYTTVPRLGGQNRQLPFWFGVAQPTAGIVYAYALNMLSQHDRSISWDKIAVGILHAAEKMQFTEGDEIGTIPEVFVIQSQEKRSWKVNPCSLFALRSALENKPNSLSVFLEGKDRYASPYPLRRTQNGLEAVGVPLEQSFQILQNGSRIINSQGPQPIRID